MPPHNDIIWNWLNTRTHALTQLIEELKDSSFCPRQHFRAPLRASAERAFFEKTVRTSGPAWRLAIQGPAPWRELMR